MPRKLFTSKILFSTLSKVRFFIDDGCKLPKPTTKKLVKYSCINAFYKHNFCSHCCTSNFQQVKYVTEPQEKVKYVSAPQEVSTPQRYFSPKKEPKSLLDSYVPSYLQVQYYKQQQQALANSIVNPAKASTAGASGKSQQQTKKTYATGGSQSSSASSLTYNYQLPAAYYAIPGARK